MNDSQKAYRLRKIITLLVATIILAWAMIQNDLWAKFVIIPFLICAAAILGENIAQMFQKYQVATIFKYIFRISFLIFACGFLVYLIYLAISKQDYSILLAVAFFLYFLIRFIPKIFSR